MPKAGRVFLMMHMTLANGHLTGELAARVKEMMSLRSVVTFTSLIAALKLLEGLGGATGRVLRRFANVVLTFASVLMLREDARQLMSAVDEMDQALNNATTCADIDRAAAAFAKFITILGENVAGLVQFVRAKPDFPDRSDLVPGSENSTVLYSTPIGGRRRKKTDAPKWGSASKLAENLANRNWPAASIEKAIARHAGDNYTTWITKTGKRIYENPATGRQIVHDLEGGYFRIFQPNTIGSQKGTYLNMLGSELRPARVGSGGVHNPLLRDVDKGLWQQETHFFVEELLSQ